MRTTKAELTAEETSPAIERLHTAVNDSTIYTLRRISPSGSTHYIRVFDVRDGRIEDITWTLRGTIGATIKNGWVVSHGGGMDMAFDLVYSIGCYAERKGWCEYASDVHHESLATL